MAPPRSTEHANRSESQDSRKGSGSRDSKTTFATVKPSPANTFAEAAIGGKEVDLKRIDNFDDGKDLFSGLCKGIEWIKNEKSIPDPLRKKYEELDRELKKGNEFSKAQLRKCFKDCFQSIQIHQLLLKAAARNPALLNVNRRPEAEQRCLVETSRAIDLKGNGWRVQDDNWQGNYGIHYTAAAYFALGGYQGQTQKQKIYPEVKGTGFTSMFELEPNTSMLFTFSGKPKLKDTGFWSLSVYDTEGYLVPNPINRFEVGDRAYNLTYEDCSHIYGPKADSSKDGPFQILIQRADQVSPKKWTNNWLPTASIMALIWRCYVPTPATTDGTYVYPVVENITAIQ